MSKLKILLIVALLVVGCGNKEKTAPWPAMVRFDGLSQSEIDLVKKSLTSFSHSFGSNVFFFEEQNSQFQITIGKLEESEESTSKAGLATYNGVFCKVELNQLVFESGFGSYLEPVVWHELGHCAGMEHDPKAGELMYYLASPKNLYSTDALSRFWNNFSGFTGL